ncbi:MAG: hypothetical protein HRT88_00265, partial [Lentisphaeraceae bacterium]|nr:hypothetical protein [Lentisphaeraceae bacterium]
MIKLSFGILLTIFMVSCGENVTQEGSSTKASSALEDEYNALMEKQKMAKMKSALEAERLREEAARLEKIKAERRSYGLQQMTLLRA